MDYAPNWQCFGLLICFFLVLYGAQVYGWILLYRLWRRNFHRKPLSSMRQRVMLFGWMLLVVFLVFYALWSVRIFIPF